VKEERGRGREREGDKGKERGENLNLLATLINS